MHISVKKTIITKTISEDKRISSSENNTTNSKIHTLCISQPQNKLTNAKLHDKRISSSENNTTNSKIHTLCISQSQNKLTNAKLHDKRISLLQYTRTNAAPHKHIKKTPPITEGLGVFGTSFIIFFVRCVFLIFRLALTLIRSFRIFLFIFV